jgi:hypothetical protein
VPAVVISPFVPAGAVDSSERDHSSVPATLREIFAPAAHPLTARDSWAQPFHTLLTLTAPRRGDLPDLSAFVGRAAAAQGAPVRTTAAAAGTVPSSYQPFLTQAEKVRRRLLAVRETEAVATPVRATAKSERAAEITQIFAAAAQRHRDELDTPHAPGSRR